MKAGIRVDLSSGIISVLDNNTTWNSVGTFNIPNYGGQPLIFKFTFDLGTLKYGKLFYGGEILTDLSSHTVGQTGVSNPDICLVYSAIINNDAVSQMIYMQDAIITINEVI